MKYKIKFVVIGIVFGIALCFGGGYAVVKYFQNKLENEALEETKAEIKSGKTDENLPKFDIVPINDLSLLNVEFTNQKGKKVKLNAIKNKVIFINVWTTWCKPCVAEFPHFTKLTNEIKNENIEFLFISDEKLTKINDFADRTGFSLPFYNYNIKVVKNNRLFKSDVIPFAIIIDKNQNFALKTDSAASWSDQSIVELLKTMAK